jgi:hypothetical protein
MEIAKTQNMPLFGGFFYFMAPFILDRLENMNRNPNFKTIIYPNLACGCLCRRSSKAQAYK